MMTMDDRIETLQEGNDPECKHLYKIDAKKHGFNALQCRTCGWVGKYPLDGRPIKQVRQMITCTGCEGHFPRKGMKMIKRKFYCKKCYDEVKA